MIVKKSNILICISPKPPTVLLYGQATFHKWKTFLQNLFLLSLTHLNLKINHTLTNRKFSFTKRNFYFEGTLSCNVFTTHNSFYRHDSFSGALPFFPSKITSVPLTVHWRFRQFVFKSSFSLFAFTVKTYRKRSGDTLPFLLLKFFVFAFIPSCRPRLFRFLRREIPLLLYFPSDLWQSFSKAFYKNRTSRYFYPYGK